MRRSGIQLTFERVQGDTETMVRLPELVKTPRLTLRRWTVDDAELLSEAIRESIDHLRPWMWWASLEPATLASRIETLATFTRDWEAGEDVMYGVFIGDTVTGGAGLHRRRGPTVLEIGYWLHVDHTGHGYATELAAALTATGLNQSGIDRVEIHHDQANLASRRVPERLGFQFVGQQSDGIRSSAEVGVDCTWATTIPPVWSPR